MFLTFSIELQVQEQPAEVRSVVYSHLEAFVPCNKEALLKRLKKLSLNIQVCVGGIFLFLDAGTKKKIMMAQCSTGGNVMSRAAMCCVMRSS